MAVVSDCHHGDGFFYWIGLCGGLGRGFNLLVWKILEAYHIKGTMHQLPFCAISLEVQLCRGGASGKARVSFGRSVAPAFSNSFCESWSNLTCLDGSCTAMSGACGGGRSGLGCHSNRLLLPPMVVSDCHHGHGCFTGLDFVVHLHLVEGSIF